MKSVWNLTASKLVFAAGLGLVAVSVFVDNFSLARLNSAKASLTELALGLRSDFEVDQPEVPVNEAALLPVPEMAAYDAPEAEKSRYENEKANYERDQKALQNDYSEKMKQYNERMKDYRKEVAARNRDRARAQGKIEREARDLQRFVAKSEISVNYKAGTIALRMLGTLFTLLGALGILLLGEAMDRLGMMVFLGFAAKTVLGG